MTLADNYKGILKGRNYNDSVHYWKGTVGTYSNWDLMNSSHVLDVMPWKANVTPGTGSFPHDYFMSYIYRGGQHIAPLVDPGNGPRVEGFRDAPLEYKGLTSTKVFDSNFGHEAGRDVEYAQWNNFTYRGVRRVMHDDLGHAVRSESEYATFGSFGPYVHKGVHLAMEDVGQALPDGYDYDYGKNKVLEWRGSPSSRAL